MDDGDPFRAFGELEVHLISNEFINKTYFEHNPDQGAAFDTWKHGTVTHSCHRESIVWVVLFNVREDEDQLETIRHIFISGLSGWVIGRSVTPPCDIQQMGGIVYVMWNDADDTSLVDVWS